MNAMKNMKKIIKTALLALSVFLCVSLCACGFVNYVEYEKEDVELSAALTEYLQKLHSLSDETLYLEDERREYLRAMLDAENELRECKTLDELREVFDRHSTLILDIPTDIESVISYYLRA